MQLKCKQFDLHKNTHTMCEKMGVKHAHIFCHMVMMDLSWLL